MAQVSHGVRRVLEIPWVYSFFQKSIQKKSIWADLLYGQFESASDSLRVLDIGCGPGTFLTLLGERVDRGKFVGIDPSPDYIRRATELFPEAKFMCGTVGTVALAEETFDLIVISGVLHHLDDHDALEIMSFAGNHRAEKGKIITVDPVFFPGQNLIAKWMARADRGQNVRTPDSIEALWRNALPSSTIQISIRSGYLRVPYNHVVCTVDSDAFSDKADETG